MEFNLPPRMTVAKDLDPTHEPSHSTKNIDKFNI